MNVPNRDSVKTVAALHQQEGLARVVVGRIDGSGGVGPVRVLASETIYPTSGPAALTGLAERVGGIDLVIRVLPPGLTVARVAPLPATEGEAELEGDAAADALSLMAETDLPSAIPAYRRAAGMIKPGRGSGGSGGANRAVGLLTAWPEAAHIDAHATGRHPRIAREACISEGAAMAVLAQALGGVDRAWTIDRQGGAMTILATGEKTILRVARVPAGEIGAEARRTAIAETSRAAGLKAGEARGGDEWLTLEPAPESTRFLGETRSPEWIAQFGLAGAAIAAFADASPAVRALVGLHETEPKAKPPILQRVSEWAGSTGRAAAIGVACVVLAVGVPIGVSMAKVRLLEKQIKNEKELLAQNARDDADLRFAKALRDRRWPMTKLLSDIAGACPVGVTLDSMELEQGAPGTVSIRGTAPDSDKLSTFRSNLDATKVFSDIATPTNNPQGEKGVQFQITAKIAAGAALTIAKPAEDFVTTPLAVRLYGEAGRGAATSRPNPRSERADRTDRNNRDRRNSNASPSKPSTRESTRETTRDNPSRTERTASKPPPTPAPIADEQIAKLSRDQAMLEWTKRKAASKQPGVDEATRTRLMAESDKAKARMDAASGGGQ